MAVQSWHASEAIKSACDKGHNWITSRATKYMTTKNGYNKIQPMILPKSLPTFKMEHCDGFDDNKERENFLKCRQRIHSVDVIDQRVRNEYTQQFVDNVGSDFNSMNLHGSNSLTEFYFIYLIAVVH